MTVGYRALRACAAIVRNQCIREFVLNRHRLPRAGGCVVACTHHAHLEPALVSLHTRRPIVWIARVEFFRPRWLGSLMRATHAIPIDRRGVPVRALRRAVEHLRRGQIVGIFPEGGVARGAAAAIRGGPIKGGAAFIALRAGVPIVPCVALNVESLTRVGPWLPAKRGRVWIAYGQPIAPPTGASRTTRRAARHAVTQQLSQAIMQLDADLRATAARHGWAVVDEMHERALA